MRSFFAALALNWRRANGFSKAYVCICAVGVLACLLACLYVGLRF